MVGSRIGMHGCLDSQAQSSELLCEPNCHSTCCDGQAGVGGCKQRALNEDRAELPGAAQAQARPSDALKLPARV